MLFGSCWVFRHCCTLTKLTPGEGTCEPSRYNAMIPSVKRILRRRSGVARAERKAPSTRDLLGVTGLGPVNGLSGPRPADNLASKPGTLRAIGARSVLTTVTGSDGTPDPTRARKP